VRKKKTSREQVKGPSAEGISRTVEEIKSKAIKEADSTIQIIEAFASRGIVKLMTDAFGGEFAVQIDLQAQQVMIYRCRPVDALPIQPGSDPV